MSRVIVVKCNIVVLYGHGDSTIPHEFDSFGACSAGEFVGCYPGITNAKIPEKNRLPNPNLSKAEFLSLPDGFAPLAETNSRFEDAMQAARLRAREKAQSILSDPNSCCKSIHIQFMRAAASGEIGDYHGWDENVP